MPTLYETLEIDKNATPEQIKSAYKKLILKWHPDKNGNSEESKIKFQKIQEAYEILSGSRKKDEHNDSIWDAQQWLDSNYSKQQFSGQGLSTYTLTPEGKRIYIDPSKLASNNPRLKFTSLDISNKNLEGSLRLVDFTNLQEFDLSGNKITELDLNNCPNLRAIRCDNYPITNLKLSGKNNNIDIRFSQSELIRDKKELETLTENFSKQVSDLEEEKKILSEQITNLKETIEENKQLSKKQITELKEEIQKEKKDLESSHQIWINELENEHNEKTKRIKDEFDWKLNNKETELTNIINKERNDFYSLADDKNSLEKRLKEKENELWRLNENLSIGRKQFYNLEISSRSKEFELTGTIQKMAQELKEEKINNTRSEILLKEFQQREEKQKKDFATQLRKKEAQISELEKKTSQVDGWKNKKQVELAEQKNLLAKKESELRRQLETSNRFSREIGEKTKEINNLKNQLGEKEEKIVASEKLNTSIRNEKIILEKKLEKEQANSKNFQEQKIILQDEVTKLTQKSLETRRAFLIDNYRLNDEQVSSLQDAQEDLTILQQEHSSPRALATAQKNLERVKKELSNNINSEDLQELCEIFSQLTALSGQLTQVIHTENRNTKMIGWNPQYQSAEEKLSSTQKEQKTPQMYLINKQLSSNMPSQLSSDSSITNSVFRTKPGKSLLQEKQNKLEQLIAKTKNKLGQENSFLLDNLLEMQKEAIKFNAHVEVRKLEELKEKIINSALPSTFGSKKIKKEEIEKLLTKQGEIIDLELKSQLEFRTEQVFHPYLK